MMIASGSPGRRLIALCLCLSLNYFLVANVNCQAEPELDDQFQDFHHDLGRISGGASDTAAQAPAPIAKPQIRQSQLSPVTRSQHQSTNQASPRVQPKQQHQTGANQRDRLQQQAGHKRNRITLVVQPHTPAPSISQLEPVVAAPALLPVSQPITEPITTPLRPQVILSRNSQSGDQQQQYASLMARVAAERQAQDQALVVQAETPARDEFSVPASPPSHTSSVPLQSQLQSNNNYNQAALGSFQSPTTVAQVVAPPSAASAIRARSFTSSLVEPPPVASSQIQPALAASSADGFVDQPEEQPSLQQVLSNGCPRKGVFSWEHKGLCDRYYMCTNGTFMEESCPNGLLYSETGAIYRKCAYNWNVECGSKKGPGPIASPGCPWQFGVFPTSDNVQCSIDYFVCEWGEPERKRCQPEGLFYDDRIKGCQWADQLGCKSEALLNFKCPPEDEDNAFWPFPRYYHTNRDVIVCVNEQPRLVHCTDEQVVEPSSLSCVDIEKKKKKKF